MAMLLLSVPLQNPVAAAAAVAADGVSAADDRPVAAPADPAPRPTATPAQVATVATPTSGLRQRCPVRKMLAIAIAVLSAPGTSISPTKPTYADCRPLWPPE